MRLSVVYDPVLLGVYLFHSSLLILYRYAPARCCSASHRQKSMNESKQSPCSRYRRYRLCDRVSFFGLAGSPAMATPRKQPLLSHSVLCHPHEHLSWSLPSPPLLHSQQAVHFLPLSSVKLCITISSRRHRTASRVVVDLGSGGRGTVRLSMVVMAHQPRAVARSQILSSVSVCFALSGNSRSSLLRIESINPVSHSVSLLSRFSQSSIIVRYSSAHVPMFNSCAITRRSSRRFASVRFH
jgi:hypothetical protein